MATVDCKKPKEGRQLSKDDKEANKVRTSECACVA
jgi:hypothetical protein